MSGKRHDDLSENEQQALTSMSHSSMPPRALEERMVGALKSRGLIRKKRGILMKLSLAAGSLAALILVFAAGVTIGERNQATTAPLSGDKQFMLLLYIENTPERAARMADVTQAEYAAMIDEYRQWGVRLSEQGRLVGAEKLKDNAYVLAGHAHTHDHAKAGAS